MYRRRKELLQYVNSPLIFSTNGKEANRIFFIFRKTKGFIFNREISDVASKIGFTHLCLYPCKGFCKFLLQVIKEL